VVSFGRKSRPIGGFCENAGRMVRRSESLKSMFRSV
jgi:hypothetical protein